MTAPASPPPLDRPSDDTKVASIAWAIATIVVALVIALIAWLAMNGRDGYDGAGAGAGSTSSPAASAPADPAQPAPGGATDQPEAQTPPPEVKAMMLELQRRDPDDPMAIGAVDAPVVMIEYADYRCPYCAKFHLQIRPELQGLVEDGTLRIEFRDLVIFEEQSQQAAVAARAAGEQGRLSEYQQAVFARSTEGHAELARQDFLDLAEQAGVPDLAAFDKALDDEKLDALVRADSQEGRAIGITSTPTFLINTAVVQGAYEAEHMKAVIEQELKAAQQS